MAAAHRVDPARFATKRCMTAPSGARHVGRAPQNVVATFAVFNVHPGDNADESTAQPDAEATTPVQRQWVIRAAVHLWSTRNTIQTYAYERSVRSGRICVGSGPRCAG